jgi:hypothetical protein
LIRRRLIATALPRDRFDEFDLLFMNVHERWAAVVSWWIRNTFAFTRTRTIRATPSLLRRTTKAQYCTPVGYRGFPREAGGGNACHNRLCPFCHARRGVAAFRQLKAAVARAPRGSKLYLVRLAGACAPRRLAYRIRSSRSAAAAGFAYPVVGRRRGEIVWRYKFVGVTDQLSRVTKKTPRVRFLKCDGEKSVAKAVTSWLTYPVEWSCPAPARAKGMDRELFKAFLLVLEQVKGAKGARPFGACRDDHSSTRSAMGFKLSQTQIDFLLNRKDKPCRKSPPSGS